MLLRPDDKGGAVVDSFLCHVVGGMQSAIMQITGRSSGDGNRPAAVIKTEMKSEQPVANEQNTANDPAKALS
jgi:hypothetical protein